MNKVTQSIYKKKVDTLEEKVNLLKPFEMYSHFLELEWRYDEGDEEYIYYKLQCTVLHPKSTQLTFDEIQKLLLYTPIVNSNYVNAGVLYTVIGIDSVAEEGFLIYARDENGEYAELEPDGPCELDINQGPIHKVY